MSVSEASILAAMSKVIDPELHVDLVKAGMVKDIRVSGDTVKLKIELTTPACPMKAKIQADSEAALKAVPGLKSFDIEWGAQVRASGGGAPPPGGLLPKVKNIILVGAGKGGVGKSTVAVNLAAALAQHGAKVGLLDADFYGPSIPLMTGLGEKKPVSPDGKSLDPLIAHGMKVMSIGFLVEADQALIWRGPMLHGALMQLVRDVNWGELDYLVLDLPPGTGDVALSLSQSIRAAGAVLVTTPQDVALADVVRAKQMFDKVHIPVLGIVENMSQFVCPNCSHVTPIFNHGGGRKAAEMFGIPFLGEVPLDLKVRVSGDSGVPVVIGAKDSLEAKAFQEVARNIAGRVSAQGAKSMPLPVVQAR
ncbi:Mrp/NBP35 family ATP-binding protein [Myxococcus sp. AM011]|uniref:Mrp/NBP35 family ATP-binding protein n=1 Tax=Myxococcus sp. AM011 TaxID=2745200 RepID=UPI001595ECD7|nr:Mrp/NBP35 family ATP-binding protein [Myxococcus sp. AM011]NVJ28490.1 Mrp/NBP35 family ATP-binding protein [Myxococcus sp. AM011]